MPVSRLWHIPGIGVDKVGDAADAAGDPRFLRLENLDTATIRRLAAAGDPVFTRIVERGDVASLDVALAELEQLKA
jgi:hypothetical protein